MKAALLFQAVSFGIGVLTLPLFLAYLEREEFVLWILFTSIGGLTIQLEYALQIVSVRRLSRFWHQFGQESTEFQFELKATNRRYLLLSVSMLCLIGPAGLIYFETYSATDVYANWHFVWIFFIVGFAINYSVGRNNAILLATNNTDAFNYINVFSRSLNFAISAALLATGLSLIGISLSFLTSVMFGVSLIYFQSQKVLRVDGDCGKSVENSTPTIPQSSTDQIIRYTAFTIMAYFLYRGALIVIPMIRPQEDLSSYGLSLQIAAITYAVAIIPTQVRLEQLTNHVLAKDQSTVLRELSGHFTFAALTFIIVFVLAALVGDSSLKIIGSSVQLPELQDFFLILSAFFIESVIFIAANILVLLNNFKFTLKYIFLNIISIIVAIYLLSIKITVISSMILIPMIIQLLIFTPLILTSAWNELKKLAHAQSSVAG